MSPEFYTIIGVAIALATLILNGQRSLARALADLRGDVDVLGRDVTALREQTHQNKAELLGQIQQNKVELLELMQQNKAELLELIQQNKTELLEQMHRDKVELLGQMHRVNAALGERMAHMEVLLGGPLEVSASSSKAG